MVDNGVVTQLPDQRPTGGSVTRRLRDDNALAVLHHVWSLETDEGAGPVTGSDLMAVTGLSRATVHDVCEELIDRGWLRELPNQREHGAYTKGRPARRYAFDATAGVVVGVDAGEHRIAARVTDLQGRTLADVTTPVTHVVGTTPVRDRLDALEATVDRALVEAGAGAVSVLAVATGVPAPVAADGHTEFAQNPFWEFMNPDIDAELRRRRGWRSRTDNDANLAALAEAWRGHGRGAGHHVTLLAGERLGAGVVDGGRVLRGARGGVGEMRYLDLVDGVGSADGLGKVVRDLVRTPGRETDAAEVFAAARSGDLAANSVVEQVGLRLTRVVATLASMYDPERVVVAGAVAGSADLLVEVVNRELPTLLAPPLPTVLGSRLGRDVVVLGAVKRALDDVRENALTIRPGSA